MKENPRDNVGGKLATIGCLQLECLFIEATRNWVLCLSGCVPCIGLFALLLRTLTLTGHDDLMFTASKPPFQKRQEQPSCQSIKRTTTTLRKKKTLPLVPFPDDIIMTSLKPFSTLVPFFLFFACAFCFPIDGLVYSFFSLFFHC